MGPKIKPSMNVLDSDKAKLKYLNRLLTEEGYKVLCDYTKTLARLFIEKKEENYPFKVGVVLGLPMFPYSQIFHNKNELLGRLKAYSQILCLEDVRIEIGRKKYIIKMDGIKK